MAMKYTQKAIKCSLQKKKNQLNKKESVMQEIRDKKAIRYIETKQQNKSRPSLVKMEGNFEICYNRDEL